MITQILKKIGFLSTLAFLAIAGPSALFGGEVIVVNDSDFDVKIKAGSYDPAISWGGRKVWDLGPYKAHSGSNKDEGLGNYVVGYGPEDRTAQVVLVNTRSNEESDSKEIKLDGADSTKNATLGFKFKGSSEEKKVKVNVDYLPEGQRVMAKSYDLYKITIKNQ